MKIFILLFLLVVSFIATYAQKLVRIENVTDHSIHVFGVDYEGMIFTGELSDIHVESNINESLKSFTPSIENIALVEKELHTKLKNVDRNYRYRNAPQISRNLRKFYVSM